MYKIFAIRLNDEIQQCEIIDNVTNNSETNEFQGLYNNGEVYSAILNHTSLPDDLINEGRIYYRLKPIDYYFICHEKNESLPENAEPFMEHKIPTPFAIQVFENIYHFSDQKESITKEIEAGKLFFSIYPATEKGIPGNALPLFEFAPAESEKIKAEGKQILHSFRLQTLKESLYLSIANIQRDPSTLIKCLFLALFSYAAAQVGGQAATNRQKLNELNSEWQDVLIKLNHDKKLEMQQVKPPKFKQTERAEINNKYPPLQTPTLQEDYLVKSLEEDDVNKFIHVLSEGYDPYQRNWMGKFTLIGAAHYNCYNILNYVANTLKIKLNPFQKPFNSRIMGDSWLIVAIGAHNYDLARDLVKWGVDVNYKFVNGGSNLHYLTMSNKSPEIILDFAEHLYRLGADIDLPNDIGYPPVFLHTVNNQTSMIKFYLDNNCKTSLPNLQSSNLLATAFLTSSLETVEFLLKYGLDPYFNVDGLLREENIPYNHIPIFAAIIRNNIAYLDLLLKYSNLSYNPRFNIKLLYYLFQNKNIPIAYYLVKRGLPLNHFVAFWEKLGKQGRPEADVIQSFLNTVKEWVIVKDQLKKQGETEIIKTLFQFDPDLLEIPQFVEFYKQVCEIKKACIEDSFKRFNRALYKLKSLPELAKHVKRIEAESSNAKISSYFMKAFGKEESNDSEISPSLKTFEDDISKSQFSYIVKIKAIIFTFFVVAVLNRFLSKWLTKKTNVIDVDHENQPITKTLSITNKPTKLIKNNLPSKTEKIEEVPVTRELKIDLKNTAEYLAIEKQLQTINGCIESCKKEKIFFSEDHLVFFHNHSNIWFKTHKPVELERECRNLQLKLNNKISVLSDKVKNILKFKLTNKLQSLNTCQTELELNKDELSRSLLNFSENNSCDKIAVFNINKYIDQIKFVQNFRIDFEYLCKEAEYLVDEIEQLKKDIEKQKILIETSNIVEEKPLKSEIIAIKSTYKKKPVSDNNVIKIKPKEKINTSSSNYVFFTDPEKKNPEKIKEDPRLHFANSLFCIIENIKNDEFKLEYKPDAALYLLMKTAHLIAQLSSPLLGYKTIIIHNQHNLYNLRNNLVHYPELCFETTDILLFLNQFYETFDSALRNLKAKGPSGGVIETAELELCCPFLFKEHRNDKSINEANQTLEGCLKGIKSLVTKTESYYLEAAKLEVAMKYSDESILHCALHGIILQFREKLRLLENLDPNLFYRIKQLMPKILYSGHKIAHQLKDDDSWELTKKERDYYAEEVIPSFSLLKLIERIMDKKKKILTLCDDYHCESKSNIIMNK
jgi:hypothetical protein